MYRHLSLLCLVSACSAIPVRSMIELSRFDPMTADPKGIAVAVELSDGLSARPGKTVMTLSAEGPGAQTLSEAFVLQENAPLSAETGRYVLTIAPSDIDRLNKSRRTITGWKAQDPDTSGSLSVNAVPCVEAAIADEMPLFMEIFFRTAQDRPFVVITPKTDLRRIGSADLELPVCGA